MIKISNLFLKLFVVLLLIISNNTNVLGKQVPQKSVTVGSDLLVINGFLSSEHGMNNIKSTLVFETESLSITWTALTILLLTYYPSMQVAVHNFVTGWQTKPGFGPMVLSWTENQIRLHFETYSNNANYYWYYLSIGCVIHTRNTYLCPMSNLE